MTEEIIIDACETDVNVIFNNLERRGQKGSISGTPKNVITEINNLKLVLRNYFLWSCVI